MDKFTAITDWDDAYANRENVHDAQGYIDRWEKNAAEFREKWAARSELDLRYGDHERERFDLFHPVGASRGLFVFVHGGYWMAFDKSSWSHLAGSALELGWSVAIPSYTLCPDTHIGAITTQIGRAIESAAGMVAGPIVLAGHSAGGHLVARMGCQDAQLNADVIGRVTRIVPISGVHDLRPLLRLKLNATLGLDEMQAQMESPVLALPREGLEIICVAGAGELREFVRQNALLANIWRGLGAKTQEIVVPHKHHFNIVDELFRLEDGWLAAAIGPTPSS